MSLAINQLSQTFFQKIQKLAFTAALFLTLGISNSFATPNDGGNHAVTASFHRDFKKAVVLLTEEKKNFTKVTFRMNDMVLFAYYSADGQLLAVIRNITSTQLPIQLLMQVKRDYSDYWITDLFEYDSDGSSIYYLTLENADTRVTLRSNDSDWEVYSKTVKQ